MGSSSFNTLFSVPSANWKVAVVAPLDQLSIPTKDFANQLLLPLLVTATLGVTIALLATRLTLVTPIKRVTRQIQVQTTTVSASEPPAPRMRNDELGQLVHTFAH